MTKACRGLGLMLVSVMACTDGGHPNIGFTESQLLNVTCAFNITAYPLDTNPAPPSDPKMLHEVTTSGGLQTAIDTASADPNGGYIVVANGTYPPMTLRTRPGAYTGWVTITGCDTSSMYAPLACPGMHNPPAPVTGRIKPISGGGPVLPKIQVSGATVAIINERSTFAAAHRYLILGFEVEAINDHTNNMVDIARTYSTEVRPQYIKFDRVRVHGGATNLTKRGILINGLNMTVVRSRIDNIHRGGAEAHGITILDSSGPYLIKDNYIAASTENIMVGGGNVLTNGDIPRNVWIFGNHLHKPDAWRGSSWWEKNLLELKNVDQAEIYENLMENSWWDDAEGQKGFAVVFTPRNSGTGGTDDSDTRVKHVKFHGNKIDRAAGGINILGSDDAAQSDLAACINVNDNLFDHIGGVTGTANVDVGGSPSYDNLMFAPRWLLLNAGANPGGVAGPGDNGISDLFVQHNTARNHSTAYIWFATRTGAMALNEDFWYLDNLTYLGLGVAGDGVTTANDALSTFWATGTTTWNKDGIIGSYTSGFPTGTLFDSETNIFGVGGVSFPTVTPGSTFDNACTHGTHDLGVSDFASVNRAEAARDPNPL